MKIKNRKELWLSAVLVMLLSLFIGGCIDENFGVLGECPVVISTDPSNDDDSDMPLNQVVHATFNTDMDPKTVTASSFRLEAETTVAVSSRTEGSSEVAGTFSFDESERTLRFQPNELLEENTTYTATVFATVKDITGNLMQEDFVWTFTTATYPDPIVVLNTPADLAINIALDQVITADFSELMEPASITDASFLITLNGNPVAGNVSYAGVRATFIPDAPLSAGNTYTATITTDAKTLQNKPLISAHVWTFTTVPAPTVTSTTPVDLAINVALNKVITADFSEPMNPASITNTSFLVTHNGNPVAGIVTYTGLRASFAPSTPLTPGRTYIATITTTVTSLRNAALVNNSEWSFSTIPPVNQPIEADFINLGAAAEFGILAGVGISNNAGFSEIRNLSVGISPGVRSSITGFPPAIVVNGQIHASDDLLPSGIAALLTQAKEDLKNVYLFLEGASAPAPATVAGDQGGLTLTPGIYKSTSTLLIQAGDLTLDAQGDANAVFIFQIASDFTTVGGAGGNIILTGGAQAKNIYWQTGSSATIGDNTKFHGNVLALTSITMNSGATAVGRMLARNGSVVLTNTNIIERP